MVGFWVSLTVTSWLAVAVLPLASATVQVTAVAPAGNWVGALLVTLATAQLSAVFGAPIATFVPSHWPGSLLTTTAAGALMVGFWVSLTVTSWLAVAVLPLASVTVQVTVVAPVAKWVGALLVTLAPAQLSAVLGVPSATLVA